MSALRAARANMRALQIFTAVPKFYNEKNGIKPERVERFAAALSESEIRPEHVIVHAGYVINCATPDDAKWQRSRDALTRELERSSAIRSGGVCFHPGSAGSSSRPDAIKRIAEAMTHALRSVESDTPLLVENTAGAGNTVGRTAKEVAAILELVPSEFQSRVGYGLDTCHLFASGYDINLSAERTTAILDEFESETGLPPRFIHLNDSQGELGSNRDRHTLIGEGCIGVEPFRWLLADRRTRGIPLILETPQLNPDIADDDDSPDPFDVQMIELLRSLAPKR